MAEEKKPVGGQDETPKTPAEKKEAAGTPREAGPAGKEKELTKIRSRNFMVLVHYLEKQDIDPCAFLHTSKATIAKISSGKQNASFFMVWRMQKGFSNISYRKVRMGKQELPSDENYGFEKRTAKLRYLDKFLVEKAQGLTLARALSLSLAKWKQLESGYDLPSNALMRRAAIYFSLPPKMLLDDDEKLPGYDQLKIDEDLAAIQRNDLAETMNYYKNKHYIARNYRVLSHSMRGRLYISLVAILLPLLGFTGYSTYRILNDRFASIQKMEQTEIIDSKSKKFKDEYIDAHTKENDATQYYCPVKIGIQVMKIFDIQPSNEYFSVSMKLWFDFSQDEFHNMYRNNVGDPIYDATPSAGSKYTQDNDIFTVCVMMIRFLMVPTRFLTTLNWRRPSILPPGLTARLTTTNPRQRIRRNPASKKQPVYSSIWIRASSI